ncbi:hypothetical protein SAMN04489806_1484 [Paramicrobacterium humi]|uniref:Asp/Glu/Hydantoin racemase n=1 Tax=Paramicrobacterium humi TaxID=640635 RepID=A0A1H4LAZ1_9MICO|nr:aspartate/glutamate racemase family protein [Microbacterium humi]SEB67919.1 hypothetical protein SAMN04489806_1484 [Microbacterium humi]
MNAPLIALVSAVPAAMAPAQQAFEREYPDATIWNLLDDRLIVEALEAGGLTTTLKDRMAGLIDHAIRNGAKGVLLTCSMYGPVAHEADARSTLPVFASDDAAFHDAATSGFTRLALVSSIATPLADARTRFDVVPKPAELSTHDVLAADALEPSREGDAAGTARALAAAVRAADGPFDAVLLAQYTLAPAAEALEHELGIPVLAGPVRAAAAMRAVLEESAR